MAGKGTGKGTGAGSYEKRIQSIKYTLFCLIIIGLAITLSILALCLWMLVSPEFQEWVKLMEIQKFYIGIYILLIGSLVGVAFTVLGAISTLAEDKGKLKFFIGTQVLGFIALVVGSAVLLNFGTRQSALQPMIRDTMRRLIMDSYNPQSVERLRKIQESIGCCGADGPNDYIALKKPLPSECRDTVTGNAFFYGCIEGMTMILEDKAAWIAALSLTFGLTMVVNIALTVVLIKLIRKERDSAVKSYRE